ncbi:5'-nucleotidase, lipoprotein e(P4) family [Pseudoxanthomonas sangjuensis]|uniref:5'-nucleotidase, lipoprotein e(P4) family n=1 Tax=Pseudoxanthomonas sangjuensis TaxID=1503750 RepID=UPI0013912FD7|nr:acid phosphatase [Pseudoxanthomonas sangjuensis]
MRPILLLACAALALGACKSASFTAPAAAPAATGPVGPAAPTAPADDNLNAVLWVQTAVEYRALSEQAYRAAADRLDQALKERNWDALVPEERANAATGLKPAVVLDVDETVLDNSPYQARLIRDGKSYDDATWDLWVAEKKAKAVPGVVDFAKAATAKGVTLVYISNRAVHLKEATLANLRAVGLPVAGDDVFLGLGTVVEGCTQPKASEKNCRRQLAGRKYRVLMQFGDQLGDFVQVKDNSAAGHAALYDEYADWFGERWFMLPNPTYGAWETRYRGEARRQAKRDALDVAE